MLVITDYEADSREIAARKGVILSARVHPGEVSSSFIMEGILNFLISNEREALKLRKLFVFKIVPMLNADGVIVGNSRSGINGLDYNRQWQNPEPSTAPEIHALKEIIRQT